MQSSSTVISTFVPDGAHAPARSFLDGFRRITSSGEFIPEIDGLRFVAVMLILVYHILVFVCGSHGRSLGDIVVLTRGVEMFFVLSGFILSLPFAAHFLRGAKPVRLKSYFLRRLTRLEPPYLICLLLYTALKMAQSRDTDAILLRNALLGSVYLHDAILGRPGIIISVAWSLEVEVQFYLLMPLLAYLFAIRPAWLRRTIVAMIALLLPTVQPIWFPALLMHNDGHLLNFIQYFLAGILLADIWVIEWKNAPPPMRDGWFSWGDLVWLMIWPLALWLFRMGDFIERLALPTIIFVMYLAMFQSIWSRRIMRLQLLTVIGGMCYSIYLMHNLVIVMCGPYLGRAMPQDFPRAAAFSILTLGPLALLVSAIYFRLIERPCMRRDWPRRLWAWFNSKLFVEEPAP